MTDFSHIEKQIEWLENESQRLLQLASSAETNKRRKALKHRAAQCRKSATTMRQMLEAFRDIEAIPLNYECEHCHVVAGIIAKLEASDE